MRRATDFQSPVCIRLASEHSETLAVCNAFNVLAKACLCLELLKPHGTQGKVASQQHIARLQ